MHLAYTECITSQPKAAVLSFEEWCKQRAERSPQLQVWQLVLKIEFLYVDAFDEPTMALPRI